MSQSGFMLTIFKRRPEKHLRSKYPWPNNRQPIKDCKTFAEFWLDVSYSARVQTLNCWRLRKQFMILNLISISTLEYMVSHRGHNCISSALTILDSALTS